MEKNTYTILEEKREEVEKKLKRLAKKAQKYSIPFSFTTGEPYAITTKHRDEDTGVIIENKYEVYDLTIESETIRKDGYTVIAHLEHSPNGNIVNVFNGEMQNEWVTRKAFCEHCNSNHNLKYTFMVSNGNEIKQVGKTCLKDYCGIDPQMVGMMNEFFEDIEEYTPEGYDFREPLPCVYDAVEILGHAIDVISEQGYIKSEERDSNKYQISKRCGTSHPSEKAYQKAQEMEKAILSMSIEESVQAYLNNVQTRLKGYYCKPSDFGYFAYAPIALEKYEEKKAKEKRRDEEREQMGAQSNYVGTVGERTTFDVKEIKLLTSFPSDYGYTYLYRFIDHNGNVMIWFASNVLKDEHIEHIKATVKAHSERDGIKQTVLTRVKVA